MARLAKNIVESLNKVYNSSRSSNAMYQKCMSENLVNA